MNGRTIKAPRRLRGLTIEGYWLTPCCYCGQTATARDHFVPRAWRRMFPEWREGIWAKVPNTVPTCTECNSIAGANPFPTIAAKRDYIKDRLRTKNAKLLASPFHSEAELNEFGKTLRSHVEKRETKRIRLLLRLAWPYEVDNVVEALTQGIYRANADPSEALNKIRRDEILA